MVRFQSLINSLGLFSKNNEKNKYFFKKLERTINTDILVPIEVNYKSFLTDGC